MIVVFLLVAVSRQMLSFDRIDFAGFWVFHEVHVAKTALAQLTNPPQQTFSSYLVLYKTLKFYSKLPIQQFEVVKNFEQTKPLANLQSNKDLRGFLVVKRFQFISFSGAKFSNQKCVRVFTYSKRLNSWSSIKSHLQGHAKNKQHFTRLILNFQYVFS